MVYFIYKRNLNQICTYKLCWLVHEYFGVIHQNISEIESMDNLWDEFIQLEDLTQQIKILCQKNKFKEHTLLSLEEVQMIIDIKGMGMAL